jgi:transcription elongation factor GreB
VTIVTEKQRKNYITPQGAESLQSELRFLLHEERPKIVQTVSWAASNGDRSENGDYIYGKRRLREIDRRVRFLMNRLEIAEVIDPVAQKGSRVLFGATVTVLDQEGVERVYRIVGIDEIEASKGHVSWISPIGRALLQKEEGDVVTVRIPKGELELEILKVEFLKVECSKLEYSTDSNLV